MTESIFYPYRTDHEGILLEINSPGVEIPVGSDGGLRAFERDLNSYEFEASVIVSQVIREKVFPPAEMENPPAEVHLVCNSIESRKRLFIIGNRLVEEIQWPKKLTSSLQLWFGINQKDL